jgi:hypothetical protein
MKFTSTKKHLKSFSEEWKIPEIIAGMLLILLFSSCDLIKIKDEGENSARSGKPIARVAGKYLYPEDIRGLVPASVSQEDSVNLVSRYINSWIKKQLMIEKASSEIEFDQAELQRKLLDYKYALMVYEYEKYYISQNLSNDVDETEIEQYYQENISNFNLKQNIIRGVYLKLQKDAPKLPRVKKLVRSNLENDKEELKSYAYRFASKYILEDTVWLYFDEVFQNTMINNIADRDKFLRENKIIETEDDNYLYLVRIDEFRLKDQRSPLEFERENIRNLILNKRKVNLSNQLEEEIFNKAKKNNDFEIYQ